MGREKPNPRFGGWRRWTWSLSRCGLGDRTPRGDGARQRRATGPGVPDKDRADRAVCPLPSLHLRGSDGIVPVAAKRTAGRIRGPFHEKEGPGSTQGDSRGHRPAHRSRDRALTDAVVGKDLAPAQRGGACPPTSRRRQGTLCGTLDRDRMRQRPDHRRCRGDPVHPARQRRTGAGVLRSLTGIAPVFF